MMRIDMRWIGIGIAGLLAGACGEPEEETSDSFGTSMTATATATATATTTGTTTGDASTTDDSTGDASTTDDPSTSTTTTGETSTTTGGPDCGDGVVDDGEECDDGNTDNTDACTNSCANATCGDGIVQQGIEDCDDGNDDDTDGCLSTCVAAACGDGIIHVGVETCDDGNDDDTDDCPSTCEAATCGDGYVQAGVEECDDGNAVSGDGCVSCVIPTSCKHVKEVDPGAGDGLYTVDFDGPDGPLEPVEVFCDQTYDDGGWMLLGKTVKEGLTAEDKAAIYMGTWEDYTLNGYGSPDPDARVYWMPLTLWHDFSYAHLLNEFYVRDSVNELRMNNMTVSDANSNYKINWATPVMGFGQIVTAIKGQAFTTHDKDNDTWQSNCAKDNVGFNGGWWYTNCYQLSMLHSNGNVYSWVSNVDTSVAFNYLYIREK
jgi:cysteine-rich repeat protein